MKIRKYRVKAVTTITGERVVMAMSREEAVQFVKREVIQAGFSSPFGNPDVQHAIYVKDEIDDEFDE